MPPFQAFVDKHGEGHHCRAVEFETIQKYRGLVPDALLEHWSQAGRCSYGNEFIWLTNPDDYSEVLSEWMGERARNTFVFGRTAFGDLFLWRVDGVYELFVHQGQMMFFIDDLADYLNFSLTQDDYLDKTLGRPLYQQARAKLGPLNYEQMYGFEPALALGGSGEIETVVKVRIYEHLSILAQVTGGV